MSEPRAGGASRPDARIAIVRHGQTQWSATGRHTSTTEIALTATGVAQAEEVPALLAAVGIHPATVWCSPRSRARETAAHAGLAVGRIVDELAEWDYGDYEGRTTADIRAGRPDWELFTDGCPGGESPADVTARADRLVRAARDELGGGDLVLVCHGHIGRALAVRWVGLPVAAAAAIALDPAAVTVLGEYQDAPIIEHANLVPVRRGGTSG